MPETAKLLADALVGRRIAWMPRGRFLHTGCAAA